MSNIRDRSLFRRLLLGFTVVVIGIWLGNLGLDVYETRTAKKKDMQRELQATAKRMLVVLQISEGKPDARKQALRQMEQLHYANYGEWGWYTPALQTQIWKNSELVYESPDAGLPKTLIGVMPEYQPLKDGWVSSIVRDREGGYSVRMSSEVIGEWMLQVSSIGYYFEPLLFSLPLLLIPAWFIIGVGLRPLKSIVGEIEERSASDLSPLAPSPYRELSSLVTSVNRLMERLTDRLEREKEFLLDAAHELKTPLSIIQVNADSLNGSLSPQRVREANEGLRRGVGRASHTVHQLLALARSDSDRDSANLQKLDLVELVRDRMVPAVQLATLRGIELEFQSPESCDWPLNRESMASLVDNLISNAIKYSPNDSRVSVSVKEFEGKVQLVVSDQGPGIPPELRKKVFERFFRLPGQDQPGSGLGLAIAERAAVRNNGAIRLEQGVGGVGLIVVVEFS